MSARDLADLLLLAALWGASFLFMRLGAGEFGPVGLTLVRVALAAAVLLPVVAWRGQWSVLRRHAGPIALVGVLNSALPFVAFSHAATVITGGLAAIFNAATPLWGALIAWLWLHERLTRSRLVGLAVGFAGVLWLAGDKAGLRSGTSDAGVASAILACLAATVCYGFTANYARRRLGGVPTLAGAGGSQAAASLVLLVPGVLAWPAATPGPLAWFAVVLLGLACTAVAYLLYFRLIANVGATRTVSVTFLIPLFALFWGWVFIDEAVTPVMIGACAVILAGTSLATGLIRLHNRAAAQRR